MRHQEPINVDVKFVCLNINNIDSIDKAQSEQITTLKNQQLQLYLYEQRGRAMARK